MNPIIVELPLTEKQLPKKLGRPSAMVRQSRCKSKMQVQALLASRNVDMVPAEMDMVPPERDVVPPEVNVVQREKNVVSEEVYGVETMTGTPTPPSRKRRERKKKTKKEHLMHKCEHCNYSTRYNGHMTAHLRTHTGERPFMCDVCGKNFAKKENLASHSKKLHEMERQILCWTCGKQFRTDVLLQRHIMAAHVKREKYTSSSVHIVNVAAKD